MSTLELFVSKWLNTAASFSVENLKGKVVAIHAFQMLCPGCILHGVPQAQKLYKTFNPELVSVIGLHTVFEHHDGMKEESLKAFLHEFNVRFPVAIDEPSPTGNIPKTMEFYQMRGTPTWLIFDQSGKLKQHVFGAFDDIKLGAEIARLALEGASHDIQLYKS